MLEKGPAHSAPGLVFALFPVLAVLIWVDVKEFVVSSSLPKSVSTSALAIVMDTGMVVPVRCTALLAILQ